MAATVLIADDDSDTRELYSRYLVHCGLVVQGVATGADALRIARENPPDLLLVDFRLPDMDGRDVLRRLREDRATADLPVIALTGCSAPADRARAHGLGCDAFLGKPCAPDSVLLEVMRVLAERWTQALGAANAELLSRGHALLVEIRANRQVMREQRQTASRLLTELKDGVRQARPQV